MNQVAMQKAEETAKENPSWVSKMHRYFSDTGAYRSGDLERVLGNPRMSVRNEAVTTVLSSCFLVKK